MKHHLLAACLVAAACASPEEQPPVHYLVEMHRAGRVVECANAESVLGKQVRVKLSDGMSLLAATTPMTGEGKTNVSLRFEMDPLGPNGFRVAHEMSGTQILTRSSSTYTYRAGPEANQIYFVVLVTSPPLLATTRGEPSWKQHIGKPLNVSNRNAAGECVGLAARSKAG